MNRTAITCSTIATLGLLGTAALLTAGPLNPPAGPVAPTYKTLAEVEPRIAINAANTPGDADSLFKITQPGSYYLTGNVNGVVGKHGIEIAASGVTLDLNGFDLVGVPGMGSFDGVSVTVGSLRNISVTNGSVRSWGDDGVDVGTLATINSRVDGIRVTSNAGNGISAGRSGTVSNCRAYQNSGNGINTAYGSTVSYCSASAHGGHGISTGSGCTVSDCSTDSNAGNGISAGTGSTVSNCSAYQNHGPGIGTGANVAVTNCSAFVNVSDGIRTSDGCTVTHCSSHQNTGSGISTGQGCTLSNCSTYTNASGGISATDGCTITTCTVRNNNFRGINANNGCQITGCMTSNNALDGISVNFSCTVSGNTCNGDGSLGGSQGGIRVLGQANRIESNNVTYADHGLLVESGGNVIVRNTIKGCTLNWSIAADNVVGPILDRAVPASAAINGNVAPDSTGSTHPNANFTY